MARNGIADGALHEGTADPGDDPASDAHLVQGLIAGSQDALARLYDRHGGAVFGEARRTSRDRWIAGEVVQETFLTLWNRAELFDPSRGTLLGWLLTIAHNRAVDRLRAANRHARAASFSSLGGDDAMDASTTEWLAASGEPIAMAGPEPGPEAALYSKETRASIAGALASLSPLERSVIILAYDAELSQSEIAARLGWPVGTVKTRTRRALRHLRDRLEPAQERGEAGEPRSDRERAGSGTGRSMMPDQSPGLDALDGVADRDRGRRIRDDCRDQVAGVAALSRGPGSFPCNPAPT
jgi:RNA polymerase sigma-70 factor (ECF subfamily)